MIKKLKFSALITFCVLAFCGFAQPTVALQGAFLAKTGDQQSLWLFVDGYSSQITYKDNTYMGTKGGPYSYDGKKLTIHIEYNDMDSMTVNTDLTLNITFDGDKLTDGQQTVWKKQVAKKQELDGLWRISGRKQGDKLSTITRGDRKTIKILVDGHFQWIAINPAVKGFYGTGGGHYSFKNGTYGEHLLFFSRDNSRVGNHLTFSGELKDQAWHHSGKSSKGDPIYEIWDRDK